LRIAQVTGFFWPKKYGSNELTLCRELVKRGHDVTVLTAYTPSKEYQMLHEEIERDEIYEGFRIQRFPSSVNFGNILTMPSLAAFLLKNDYDILHTHEFFAPCSFYSAFASKTKKTPLIVTQHNDQLPESLSHSLLYLADALTFGQVVLRQASKVIALSRDIKTHLLTYGASANRVATVPNGVDTTRFAPNKGNYLKTRFGISGHVVLYAGRLLEIKGIRYLLPAFGEVLKEVPDAKLVLVGAGPLKPEIAAFQQKFPGSVFCLDMVDYADMAAVYGGCDVFVMPSLEERFGNTVIEALSCGKPVVGSYVGGIKETVVHGVNGFHVAPRSSAQIARCLIRLLRDDGLRVAMGRAARQSALENYSNGVLANRVEAIYYESLKTA
jgi:glycosyltransferase involved in cell wall biosynthesis